MTSIWQNVAAVGIVLAAAVYLAWRAWPRSASKGRPSCRTCRSCGTRLDESVVVHLEPAGTQEELGR